MYLSAATGGAASAVTTVNECICRQIITHFYTYPTTVEACKYNTIPLTLMSTILYMERAESIDANVGEGRRRVNPL